MVYMSYDKSSSHEKETELQPIDKPLFWVVFSKSNGFGDENMDLVDFQISRMFTVRQNQHFSLEKVAINCWTRSQSRVRGRNAARLDLSRLRSFLNEPLVDNQSTVFRYLEVLSDDYHGHTRANVHMGRVPVPAFHPFFWLHHW